MSDPKSILLRQISTVNSIINFTKNTKQKKAAAQQTVHYFESHLKLLEGYWTSFIARHEVLIEHCNEFEEHEYFSKDGYTLAETAYVDAVAELNGDIERLRTPATVITAPVQQRFVANEISSLPKVSLPTFTGNQDEWESFKQRFSSLIRDNPSIPNVTKLQHLMNAVQGPAAVRLKSIEITAANFQGAWDMLTRRYDNPRIRLSKHLDKLIQLPQVHSRNVTDLNMVLDQAEEAVRALTEMQCPIQHYDNWLVHCIVRKLDPLTREHWQILQENKDQFSKYKDLVSFLERRIQSYEEANLSSVPADVRSPSNNFAKSVSKNSNSKSKLANAYTIGTSDSIKQSPSCALCKAPHSINSCEQFKLMTPVQRNVFCKQARVCLNCLAKSHFVNSCTSKFRCLSCKGKHHSKLLMDSAPVIATAEQESQSAIGDDTRAHIASTKRATLPTTTRIIVSDLDNSRISVEL